MEAIVFWVIAGCILGATTGLLPGIHVNTVSLIAVSLFEANSAEVAAMIAAMAIVHSFTDFVPSIMVGIPDNESYLSLLPGHRMAAKGKALLAVKLTVLGGMIGGIIAIAIAPFFFLFLGKTEEIIARIVPIALALVLLAMVFSEKNKKAAISVVCLSAVLGITVLDTKLQLKEPLFLLITGFFGTSGLLHSMNAKQSERKQETKKTDFFAKKILSGSIIGVASGMIVAILPSIGASQAAFIVKSLAGKITTYKYLVVLGAISCSNAIFAFFALFAIGKTRSGTAAAISRAIEGGEQELVLIVAAIITAIGIGALITIIAAETAAKNLEKADRKKTSIAAIFFLLFLGFAFSGTAGIIVIGTATAIGLAALHSGIKRTACMSFLIVPTLIFYLHTYYSIL